MRFKKNEGNKQHITNNKQHTTKKMQRPEQILRQSHISTPLFQIGESYDRHNWQNATTVYRKPSYQRIKTRSKLWCKGVIDSILLGLSIGALHLSEWLDDGGTFYNVEDGQTRLDAIMRFLEGTVESSFGKFADLTNNMRRRFENYQLCIILQRKRNNTITDEEYFRTLNRNFGLLQEGTQLTPSDRYACQFPDPSVNFTGAQLVLYTINFVNVIFSDFFNNILRVQVSNRLAPMRSKIADMIAIVSSAIYGCQYAHGKYFPHMEIMYRVMTDEERAQGIQRLRSIINTITSALEVYPRQPHERIYSLFGKTKPFIGSMLCDLEENPDQNIQSFQQRWEWFINVSRRKSNIGQKSWIENNVYNTLSAANRRNNSRIDYLRRMQCVHVFYARATAFPENIQNELESEQVDAQQT